MAHPKLDDITLTEGVRHVQVLRRLSCSDALGRLLGETRFEHEMFRKVATDVRPIT